MMQRSKSLQSRRGWMLNHHAAGADIGRPLFTDKRAPVTFAETPTSYTPLTQKKQVLGTEGKWEGEQLDNKHEKAAVGEQRHEEDHDSDLPQHTNNSQARQMQTGNEGVGHASRASPMPHTYNSSQLDHIFNPMPPSEPKRDEVSKGRGKRNYLKEHRVAISEMSTSLHAQKQTPGSPVSHMNKKTPCRSNKRPQRKEFVKQHHDPCLESALDPESKREVQIILQRTWRPSRL